MSWTEQHAELEAFARGFDKAARLKVKKSKLWVGTLKTNATTLGRTVYIAEHWSEGSVRRVIPHEVLGHVKQFRYCGLGIHPSLGFLGMLLLYVWGGLFPIGLAWIRYRLELHADTQSWEYHLGAKILTPTQILSRARYFADRVASSAYIWPVWRSWAQWGFNRRANKVIRKNT